MSAEVARGPTADVNVDRNRGTEFIKSPEMLLVANASKKEAKWYDRRKRQGAGAPSDVWSLGCLLFEIVTGDYLFHDDDWIRFFIRVTQAEQVGRSALSGCKSRPRRLVTARAALQVIPEEQLSRVEAYPAMQDLLKYILVRPPTARPVPEAISAR